MTLAPAPSTTGAQFSHLDLCGGLPGWHIAAEAVPTAVAVLSPEPFLPWPLMLLYQVSYPNM